MDTVYSKDLISLVTKKSNISKKLVKTVVDNYNGIVLSQIELGYKTNYLGLVTFKGKGGMQFIPSGYQKALLAADLDLTYNVVDSILSVYEDEIKNILLEGKEIVIYGVFKISKLITGSFRCKRSSTFSSRGIQTRIFINPSLKISLSNLVKSY